MSLGTGIGASSKGLGALASGRLGIGSDGYPPASAAPAASEYIFAAIGGYASNAPPAYVRAWGTMVGDAVLAVWGQYDGVDYTANFESEITFQDFIQQTSGSLNGNYFIISLLRGGGTVDDAANLLFAYVVTTTGEAGAITCPGAQSGDTVVEVLAAVYASGASSTNLRSSLFESTISVTGQIQQTGSSVPLEPLMVVLKRGDDASAEHLIMVIWFVLAGNGAGARTCPGARVGDAIVNVCGCDEFGAPTIPAVERSVSFQGTITVDDQIQQTATNLTGLYNLVVLIRTI